MKKNNRIIYGDRSQKDIPVQVYLSFDFPPWIGNQYYENIFTKRFRPFLNSKFLSKKIKNVLKDITVIYAFARTLDNLVDDSDCLLVKYNALYQAKRILNFVYDETSDLKPYKMALDLKNVIQKYQIEKKDMLNLVQGISQDVEGFKKAPSFCELNAYIYNVSIVSGLILDCFFQGKKDPAATAFIIDLYRSAQYYNIITNIKDDAKQGRIYIPKEVLEKHGLKNITPQNILQYDLRPVIQTMVHIADRYNQLSMKRLKKQKNYRMQFTYWFINKINDEYKNKIIENGYNIVDETQLLSFQHRIIPMIKAGFSYGWHQRQIFRTVER
ncbi:MAG: hypothetical protein E7014_05345 [Alphaproteobacteria bacterium]|nr:hypothetical protein [Alphaproteobacteria bacterium]